MRRNIIRIVDLGIALYEETYLLQRKIVTEKKINRSDDCLILVEHPNIFTIGRSGKEENILVTEDVLGDNGLKTIKVDRGGDITFHGFGQLVAYPIFDLRNYIKDIRFFIKSLESILGFVVSEYGLVADKGNNHTGLWVDGKKVGFIGIGISDWITYHGVSINANVDLKYFSMIKPCGIDNLEVSSLQKILNRDIDLKSLKDLFIEKCCEVFCIERSYRCAEDAFMVKEKTVLA